MYYVYINITTTTFLIRETRMANEEINDKEHEHNKFKPNVRWVIPNQIDQMTFVGRDVLAVAHDIYIIFLNLKSHTENVYVANNNKSGDGVDAITGHKANLFAFSEKLPQARIFIVSYPSFNIFAELKDNEVNRYKGLCMMECELVAGFSGFPNYLVSVWSWRTGQRLLSLPTGIVRRDQIYVCSPNFMLICECWGSGLAVWDVARCYRRCLALRRASVPSGEWDIPSPSLVAVCWAAEGQLYALDSQANLYSVLSDGIDMVTELEWSEDLSVMCKPLICSFHNGLLVYGPDKLLRCLKKAEAKWKVVWTYMAHDVVVRMVSNTSNDVAAMWTYDGLVYKLTGDSEEKIDVKLITVKQRQIIKIQLIAPSYNHVATINNKGVLAIYELLSSKLITLKYIKGVDVSFETSPVDPLLVVFGEVGDNYGMALYTMGTEGLQKISSVCLTHQIVSRIIFSPTGRELVAAAMSAGHIFLYELSPNYELSLVRYLEVGRGLADCTLLPVGDVMRCFLLVLFSDKYPIGERIICINAETGKDNKFAGKMQGPYSRLLAVKTIDTMVAIPHLSRQYHILKLAGDKGVTVQVRIGAMIETGHDIKLFDGFFGLGSFLTYSHDGTVVKRGPDALEPCDFKLTTSHRFETGIRQSLIDANNRCLIHLGNNHTLSVQFLYAAMVLKEDPKTDEIDPNLFDKDLHEINIIGVKEKNYLDLQEEKKVHEEELDYRSHKLEIVQSFEVVQSKLVALLEENLAAPPLHQLSLAEFNLHTEHKKERLKQAEIEREEIRLQTEARMRAQDKVCAWIKRQCWDTMLSPRVKLFAIFSHHQVENYAVLPTQRDNWPELRQIEALRTIEAELHTNLFRPWEEQERLPSFSQNKTDSLMKKESSIAPGSVFQLDLEGDGGGGGGDTAVVGGGGEGSNAYSLYGSSAHKIVPIPMYTIPQTLAHTFLHMDWLQHIVKLNVQNVRLWFNKQFDELMTMKKREVGLLEERNARLRFIISELNKLSDLRGSFHHLTIEIKDPVWRQEEQPLKLIKVEPEECSIAPYISPSQIVIVPPDYGPKDDFRERALIEMMDGVLEKLWHEEIKKPIPMPQCMLEKDPEHFNEDDLRTVFEYEAKVSFRNEERDKYRKMLHAEYAKLAQTLNEGIVKFNHKVKESWLLRLRVDSIIGQENLILMRQRRTNLDRVEMAEKIEFMRSQSQTLNYEIETLQTSLRLIQEQSVDCQSAYDALAQKDRQMDKGFKNHFADLSPIIVEQCYKVFKKRPKWHQRSTLVPVVLYELANSVLSGCRHPILHLDCVDYYKGVEQLDQISNMPPVMDEGLWVTMCKLRRTKIDNEIRMRALIQEMAYVDGASNIWNKAILARKNRLAQVEDSLREHRENVELMSRNKTIQLVLPAGQVEIMTTGHMEDFEDATLILREDIDKINNLILRVGETKLRMMRKQMEFRRGILAREWEHAQARMRQKHLEKELYSYKRLKIPKELQQFLKRRAEGITEEQEYVGLEKEAQASRLSIEHLLASMLQRVEEQQLKISRTEAASSMLERRIAALHVQTSEKRLLEDPLQPIRQRKILSRRMETLVVRGRLVRDVQQNHTTIALLQTELELLRLRTFPTLATFRTLDQAD